MQVLMLAVVIGRNLRQQPSHHLDNIGDWHRANFVLLATFLPPLHSIPRSVAGPCQNFLARKTLYVTEISDFDAARRRCARTGE